MWTVKLVFFISAALYVNALTEDEVKAELTKLVMKCTKDHPVEMTDLLALQQLQVPKKKEVKCLLACAYKLEGMLNSKGLYDIEHAYKVAELTKNGDEKRLVNAKKMADVCVKVNEVEVSDGEKGCERAALIFKCTLENAPKAECVRIIQAAWAALDRYIFGYNIRILTDSAAFGFKV